MILGEKTSANPTMWWAQGYTYNQQVGENIVGASLASGTALAVPFTAYGFPDETTATMRMLHGDGTTVDILSFAGFVSVAVEDQYCNPISNETVKFTSTDVGAYCVPTGENRLSALLVPVGDPCITSFPTYGTCSTSPNAGKALTAITNYRDAAVQIFTGAVPGAAYPIIAVCGKIQDTAKNTVTFTLHTNAFGNCDGGSAPSSKFFLGYVYAADQYGHNIDAGAVGSPIPLMARMYFLREGVTTKDVPVTCGDNSGICKDAIVGSTAYYEDTDFATASLSFGGDDKLVAPVGNGIYKKDDYKVEKLGPNDVSIHGIAKAATSNYWTSTGCDGSTIICNPATEEVKGDQTTTMRVYGVAITVLPKLLVMVDQDGYTVGDIPITYTIAPAEYQAATAYVAILKKDASGKTEPLVYIPAETSGEGTATLSRGFWFNLDPTSTYTYEAQVILNYGTGVEIKSEKIIISFKCDIALGYTAWQNRYDEIIKCAAQAAGIDPQTIKEVIKAESDFVTIPANKSADKSTGLMQIIPDTARAFGLTGTDAEIVTQLENPCINIEIGSKYLSEGLSAIKQALNNAGISYSQEDLRVYLETYFNLGEGVFQHAVDTASGNSIGINGWTDFTLSQEKLGGTSIMRKAVGDKLKTAAALSTPKRVKKGSPTEKYDKNGNGILEETEWYDWRTLFVLFQARMQRVSAQYNSRLSNCFEGSFDCDMAKRNEQCNK